jgi:predicted nucleotidyltransferase
MATERLLQLLNENKAVFIVIGATAFPVYGYARATLDIDLFVKPTRSNILKVMKALRRFGYDLEDLTANDFLTHKVLIRQYDLETDIHPFVKGVDFRDIWKSRIKGRIGEADVFFPSLEMMIRMKQNAGRAKDREDLKFLRRLLKKKSNSVKSAR